jgi:uncharacterized protein YegL
MSGNQLGDIKDRPVLESSIAHVAIALVLDVSASMQNDGKIQSLNDAVNGLIKQMQADTRLKDTIDLGVFVFGEKGKQPIFQGFRAMSECGQIYLEANDSSTYVVDALNSAVESLRERVILYAKSGGAYKPWVILITDGSFHDDQSELNSIGGRIKQRETENKLHFFGLGVSGFDRSQLESLTNNSNHIIEVKAANFTEFLSWVGRSMATISSNAIGTTLTLEPVVLTV